MVPNQRMIDLNNYFSSLAEQLKKINQQQTKVYLKEITDKEQIVRRLATDIEVLQTQIDVVKDFILQGVDKLSEQQLIDIWKPKLQLLREALVTSYEQDFIPYKQEAFLDGKVVDIETHKQQLIDNIRTIIQQSIEAILPVNDNADNNSHQLDILLETLTIQYQHVNHLFQQEFDEKLQLNTKMDNGNHLHAKMYVQLREQQQTMENKLQQDLIAICSGKEDEPKKIEVFLLNQALTKQDKIKYLAQTDHASNSLLHLASFAGNVKISEYLIQKDKTILYRTNHYGYLAIHLAAESGGCEVLNLLLGIDATLVNVEGEHKYTPMHRASARGQLPAVKLLVERGAKLEAFSSRQLTPLHEAVVRQQPAVIQYLLSKGANYLIPNSLKENAVETASRMGNRAVLQAFLNSSKVEIPETLGEKLLQEAKEKNQHAIEEAWFDYLVQKEETKLRQDTDSSIAQEIEALQFKRVETLQQLFNDTNRWFDDKERETKDKLEQQYKDRVNEYKAKLKVSNNKNDSEVESGNAGEWRNNSITSLATLAQQIGTFSNPDPNNRKNENDVVDASLQQTKEFN